MMKLIKILEKYPQGRFGGNNVEQSLWTENEIELYESR